MKFTIDTEADGYEQALRAVQAAYGRPPVLPDPPLNITVREEVRRRRTGDTGPAEADVIWRHGRGAWSEDMLRRWVDSLPDEDCAAVAKLMFATPGRPGTTVTALATAHFPELGLREARHAFGAISRRMNRAARELGGPHTPCEMVEATGARIADPAVAAIVMDQLAKAWPKTAHPHFSAFIAAAVAPITAALAALGEARIAVRTEDVLISYTSRGCTVRVAEHRAAHRSAVEHAFRTAFTAAGWGTEDQGGGLALEHPSVPRRN
ncbi:MULTISPECIES: hypothetical protein [Streptomyces]|uniref:Uncharacterized protein n=1 Tax=Streptomyces harbinensis TaxID=1176198 RepID=A0A1I6WCU7_9ACTN|nr:MULTISPECIES: hypothetical protein [Streptomyces]SFT23820.1 hypothetical protein SAMN05444716_1211 [Streptomyces harbinensis]